MCDNHQDRMGREWAIWNGTLGEEWDSDLQLTLQAGTITSIIYNPPSGNHLSKRFAWATIIKYPQKYLLYQYCIVLFCNCMIVPQAGHLVRNLKWDESDSRESVELELEKHICICAGKIHRIQSLIPNTEFSHENPKKLRYYKVMCDLSKKTNQCKN